jgi:hypothetical protein
MGKIDLNDFNRKEVQICAARLVGYSKEVRNLRDLASLLVNGGGGGNRISASFSNIPIFQRKF